MQINDTSPLYSSFSPLYLRCYLLSIRFSLDNNKEYIHSLSLYYVSKLVVTT